MGEIGTRAPCGKECAARERMPMAVRAVERRAKADLAHKTEREGKARVQASGCECQSDLGEEMGIR